MNKPLVLVLSVFIRVHPRPNVFFSNPLCHQPQRFTQARIVADPPDAAVQVVMCQAEAAEETEGEVGDLTELEPGNAIARAEKQRGGDVCAQASAQHRLARVAIAVS